MSTRLFALLVVIALFGLLTIVALLDVGYRFELQTRPLAGESGVARESRYGIADLGWLWTSVERKARAGLARPARAPTWDWNGQKIEEGNALAGQRQGEWTY